MKRCCLSVSMRLWFLLTLSGCLSAVAIGPGWAEIKPTGEKQEVKSQKNFKTLLTRKIRQLSEIERPSTSAIILVQSPAPQTAPSSIVQVTGVQAKPTEKGVEVILQTAQGEQLQITNRSAENNFIADIPNTQLRLPSGDTFTFRSQNPVTGITEITVTNLDANTIRVTVTGEGGLPKVELFDGDEGLIFGVIPAVTAAQQPQTPQAQEKPTSETPQEEPAAQQDEPIELVVTGEQDGYRVQDATTATRTDTPLRDIPQSIQVIPRQVLEDRKPRTLTEAVETVSGVSSADTNFNAPAGTYIIRGFQQGGNLRNGYRDVNGFGLTGLGTIERVEVLKGPASVLFGALEPGGVINVITKQPLSEPYYNLGLEVGNRGFVQPSIDFSGPLNDDKTLLYRLNASYQNSNGFQDFVNTNLTTIAPSISWKLGDRTDLNLYYEHINFNGIPETFTTVFSDNTFKLPRSRYLSYPLDGQDYTTHKYGYTLTHKFSDDWQIRNNFAVTNFTASEEYTVGINLVDDRFLQSYAARRNYSQDNYFGQIDLLGKFNTGSIPHQLLFGFDVNRYVDNFNVIRLGVPLLDVFNPNYNIPEPQITTGGFSRFQTVQSYGFYLQDQISFQDNLKLLIGGRFDWITQKSGTDESEQNDSAFSPRIGLVYQPSKSVSLYTNYTQSFNPTQGFNPDDSAFEPTKGTQYEVGIKADFLEGRLSTTLAAYQISKTNVVTTDPDPERAAQGFSTQVGEQRSRGIELDIAGEILPGWKVSASYAYTNAEVSEDVSIPIGNRLEDVPYNQASLWTTYQIQNGDLKGLGFGLGLFYVGTRAGNLANSFEIPDYLRTDAAIYYRRDAWKAAINIRNLFDTEYYGSSSGLRTLVRTGAPFTIIGSMSWEF
ncbi:TonB-dependent siderophore receptor [Nostoc sp. UHCC 0252]|uniref:TonB-dependent siderophore receptor n=1 Tax=Nostoc sp. UHCC 0252 TaxID=3110241 RepID=UPI002B218748|nr:TonB-dependent siderophore receptor [Nostoc sp. UHCC 0252]MEA5605705.1 TonB-dependent siderophore receptor [Nostoc sp. UHCC 0252]